jgi:hypothetical protein
MADAHVVADRGRARQFDVLQYHMLSGVATSPQFKAQAVAARELQQRDQSQGDAIEFGDVASVAD